MTPAELALRLSVIVFAIPAYGLWAYWCGVRVGKRWATGKFAA